jgi:hypothetical protein
MAGVCKKNPNECYLRARPYSSVVESRGRILKPEHELQLYLV